MLGKLTKTSVWFDRSLHKLARPSITYLMLFALLADIMITCLFSFVLFPENNSGPEFGVNVADFLLIVIIAPLVETAIVQSGIVRMVLKYTKGNKLLAVLFSALVFGLAHHYSIAYMLKGFFAGAIYGILWFAILDKQKRPFLYVVLTHGIYNLTGFVINAYT